MKYWPYITVFLLGFICGMISLFFIIRDKIQSKQIHVNKAKVKGEGNTQDLDMEFEESEELSRRQKRKQDKENEKLDKQLREKGNELLKTIQNKVLTKK